MSRWDSLLAVQEHDTNLDQLSHQIEALPERTVLSKAMAELDELERSATAVEAERTAIGRDQQRIEDEVSTLQDKATHSDAVLYGGTISNPRELQSLQDEIGALRRRISTLEDRELELMEAAEPLDARLASLGEQRKAIDERAGAARAAIAEAEVSLGADLEGVRTERAELAEQVDAGLLAEYEALRPRLGGIAIARLVGTNCGGCHLSLSAMEIDRIKKLSPEEAVHCEECGRLLAR